MRLVRNSSRCSRWVSSRYARRDSTTLLRFLSSSMILHSSSRPTNGCRSRTRRRSTSDAGRKPRRPMSRISPPFTTSMTGPLTTPSSFLSFSMLPHARSYCARFFERISRPSLSSFWRTSASSSSPSVTISDGLTSLRIDSSLEGMTPSDLKPMSRSTSSESILTTVPVTRPPSSNDDQGRVDRVGQGHAAEVVEHDLRDLAHVLRLVGTVWVSAARSHRAGCRLRRSRWSGGVAVGSSATMVAWSLSGKEVGLLDKGAAVGRGRGPRG